MNIGQSIVAMATTYLGKEEIQPNQGFKDPNMDHDMRTIGLFETGNPWCASLMILIWSIVYKPHPKTYAWFRKLISANSQQMGRNFHADPTWKTSTTTPVIGAAVIFAEAGSSISGHTASAVISIDWENNLYTTIEGNTIPKGNPGNQREGYIVATHTHVIGAPHSQTGLQFIRFIYPEEPID